MKKFVNLCKSSNFALTQQIFFKKSSTKLSSSLMSNLKTNAPQTPLAYQKHIEDIVAQRKKHLNPMMALSYKCRPLKLRRGIGQYFHQENDQITLDCINNVSHIGHCHPEYVARMEKQLETLLTNSRFIYDGLMEATHKLLKKLPPQLSVVTYVNSGSQANDKALQMAQIHSRRKGIICLDGAYHGITKACLDISPYKWNQFVERNPNVKVAKSPCTYRGFLRDSKDPQTEYANYIESLLDENTGTFICEYMQSCAGQIIPPKGLFKHVYSKLKQRDIVTIGDQVQTGFGRLGDHFWAFEHYGVIPDILTIGKAMGNGFPVSAVVCTKEVAESYHKRGVELFSTFGGNPLAATAVGCVLDVIDKEKLQKNARVTGKYLNKKLEKLCKKYSFVGEIRGTGFFQGIDIVKDKNSRQQDGDLAKQIITLMRERHILISRDGVKENVLKFKPPLVFNKDNVDHFVQNLNEVFKQLQVQK